MGSGRMFRPSSPVTTTPAAPVATGRTVGKQTLTSRLPPKQKPKSFKPPPFVGRGGRRGR